MAKKRTEWVKMIKTEGEQVKSQIIGDSDEELQKEAIALYSTTCLDIKKKIQTLVAFCIQRQADIAAGKEPESLENPGECVLSWERCELMQAG